MFRLILALAPLVILGCWVVFAQRPEPPSQPNQDFKPISAPPTMPAPRAKRIREGTAFKDMFVYFRQTGDRTVLYTVGDNQRFTCLENLALDRILTTMREKPKHEYWKIVEGQFTEFRGENFVLIHRAVVALPPESATPTVP